MAVFGGRARGERTNAVVGWTMTGVVTLGAVESFWPGSWLWTGVALSLAVVAILAGVIVWYRNDLGV